MKIRTFSDLQRIKNRGLKSLFPKKTRISVGLGSCGIETGAENVYNVLIKEAKKNKLNVSIARTGCLGFCGEEPLVNLARPHAPLLIFHRVTEEDARKIITKLADNEVYDKKVFCKIEKMDNFIEPKGIKFGNGYSDTHKWLPPPNQFRAASHR